MATRRSPLAYALVALGLLAVLAFGGLAVASFLSQGAPAADALGLADGRLRPCESPSNCVCSEGDGAQVEPLAFEGAADDARRRLLELLAELPRVELVAAEPRYVHAVFRSKVFRFADDVEFRIDEDAGTIELRSASRVGRSDLGANAKRVAELRARWDG
jgi:uncharacterized protein (DUF1499 family)